jgi:hypothetical protein
VIGHVRRQYDHADDFCHADRARLSSGTPTRTGGALAPRSGSGAAALPKSATEPACGARQTGDTMMTSRHGEDGAFVERHYVFTGNGVFVCKTNGHTGISSSSWRCAGAVNSTE